MVASLTIVATAPFGLEAVVARELQALGYADTQTQDGRVSFTGDATAVCRCNLWLRSADRVLVELGRFEAADFDQLFEGVRELPWPDWLPEDARFPVTGKSVRSQLTSLPHCQAVVKKAIVESLKARYQRIRFEETGGLFPVEISLVRNTASVSIDTSGPGLHKRGYRLRAGAAPLRETLAAALVQLSVWDPERPFWDPFCGAGTIAIEAAWIGLDRAPGLDRHFVSERWPQVPAEAWTQARQEARDRRRTKLTHRLLATDADPHVLRMARDQARTAGVFECIHWQQKPVSEVSSRRPFGCLITNPPYGQRLGTKETAERAGRDLVAAWNQLDRWSLFVLTADEQFERLVQRKANRRRKLYNGRLKCTYFQVLGPRPPDRPPSQVEESPQVEESQADASDDQPSEPVDDQ